MLVHCLEAVGVVACDPDHEEDEAGQQGPGEEVDPEPGKGYLRDIWPHPVADPVDPQGDAQVGPNHAVDGREGQAPGKHNVDDLQAGRVAGLAAKQLLQ
eukprot:scaffold125299_cov38-Prasinocladus_malaysianus.AAC.1